MIRADTARRSLAGAIALVFVGLALSPGSPAKGENEVEELAVRLALATPGSRGAVDVLEELRRLAGGPVNAAVTRNAVFELALYRKAHPDSERRRVVIAETLAAVSGYADDPRTIELLPFLAEQQLEIEDPYGAHLAYLKFHKLTAGFPDAEMATRAAHNAARALDARAALEWASPWVFEPMSDTARADLHLARLKGSDMLGRTELALESLRALELHARSALHEDGDALIAAGKALEKTGLKDEALAYLTRLSNVHPDHPQRAGALIDASRLARELGRPELANEMLVQVMAGYPETDEAVFAQVAEIELRPRKALPKDIDDYVAVARRTDRLQLVGQVLDAMLDRMLAEGYALEAYAALVYLSVESDDLASVVAVDRARKSFAHCLEQVLAREDAMAAAALSTLAERVDASIPADLLAAVDEARDTMGLSVWRTALVRTSLEDARTLRARGDHDGAAFVLRGIVHDYVQGTGRPDLEVITTWAESRWRAGGTSDALEWLRELAPRFQDPDQHRQLRLLEADLTFGERPERACPIYREVADIASSPWVEQQLSRCDASAEENDA